MNRGMRLQNYQRTFLRVNPSSSSFSSFRFLSPPSFPPFSSSRCGSVDESKQLSIYPRCATRLSTVVKGIIRRKIVMWYNIVFLSFFFCCLSFLSKWDETSFWRGSNERYVRYFFLFYLSRLSSLEDWMWKKKRNANSDPLRYPITFQSLSLDYIIYRHILTLFQYKSDSWLVVIS